MSAEDSSSFDGSINNSLLDDSQSWRSQSSIDEANSLIMARTLSDQQQQKQHEEEEENSSFMKEQEQEQEEENIKRELHFPSFMKEEEDSDEGDRSNTAAFHQVLLPHSPPQSVFPIAATATAAIPVSTTTRKTPQPSRSQPTTTTPPTTSSSSLPSTLKYCQKLSDYLHSRGFNILYLHPHDIFQDSLTSANAMEVSLVERWAESLLGAVSELCDQMDSQKATLSASASSVYALHTQSSASKDAMQYRIADLQALLLDAEKKEKALLAKITQLELKQKDGRQEMELKKKIRNLEDQVQEAQRRMRAKEVDFDRLREKLSQTIQKDREETTNQRHLLQRLLRNSSRTSSSRVPAESNNNNRAAGTSGSGSGGKGLASLPVSEDVYKVLEALDSHRKDLMARNRELEMQVNDLLQPVSTSSTSTSFSSSVEPVVADKQKSTRHILLPGGRSKGQPQLQQRQPTISVHTNRPLNDDEDDDDVMVGEGGGGGRYIRILKEDLDDLHTRLRQREEEYQQLQRHMLSYTAEREENDKLTKTLRQEVARLTCQLERLQYDLNHRPSIKEYHRLQYTLEETEKKLDQYILHSTSSSSNIPGSIRKHITTTTQMKIDKLNYQLQLYLLDSCSKDILLETIKSLCRELDLSDLSDLLPAIIKLKSAVTAIPSMEKYIIHINSYLIDRNDLLNEKLGVIRDSSTNRGSDRGSGSGGRKVERIVDSMEEVKVILPRWWNLVQQSVDLARFRECVLMELFRSQTLLSHGPTIAKAIRELVDLQIEVFQYTSSSAGREGGDLNAYLQGRPDLLLTRLIQHILYLFDIPHVDGMIARLNQIFLQHQEMSNFLQAIKTALHNNRHLQERLVSATALGGFLAFALDYRPSQTDSFLWDCYCRAGMAATRVLLVFDSVLQRLAALPLILRYLLAVAVIVASGVFLVRRIVLTVVGD
eukprot:gene4538-4971_t